jgi:hypothetical protein
MTIELVEAVGIRDGGLARDFDHDLKSHISSERLHPGAFDRPAAARWESAVRDLDCDAARRARRRPDCRADVVRGSAASILPDLLDLTVTSQSR